MFHTNVKPVGVWLLSNGVKQGIGESVETTGYDQLFENHWTKNKGNCWLQNSHATLLSGPNERKLSTTLLKNWTSSNSMREVESEQETPLSTRESWGLTRARVWTLGDFLWLSLSFGPGFIWWTGRLSRLSQVHHRRINDHLKLMARLQNTTQLPLVVSESSVKRGENNRHHCYSMRCK